MMECCGGIEHEASGGQLDFAVAVVALNHQRTAFIGFRIFEKQGEGQIGSDAAHQGVVHMGSIGHAGLVAGQHHLHELLGVGRCTEERVGENGS